jgi:hypothetical protein
LELNFPTRKNEKAIFFLRGEMIKKHERTGTTVQEFFPPFSEFLDVFLMGQISQGNPKPRSKNRNPNAEIRMPKSEGEVNARDEMLLKCSE